MPLEPYTGVALCRAFFRDKTSCKGWMEEMWFPNLRTIVDGEAARRANNWLLKRSALLGYGVSIERAMVSVDGPFRDELPVPALTFAPIPVGTVPTNGGPFYWKTQFGYGAADLPTATLLVRGYAQTGLYQNNKQLSGIPDSMFVGGGFSPSVDWKANFAAYITLLTGLKADKDGNLVPVGPKTPPGLYGFRVHSKDPLVAPRVKIIGGGIGLIPPETIPRQFVVAPGHLIAEGDTFRIGQVTAKAGNVNGVWQATRVSDTMVGFDNPTDPMNEWASGGVIHKLDPIVVPYTDFQIVGPSSRARGLGFSVGRGRGPKAPQATP